MGNLERTRDPATASFAGSQMSDVGTVEEYLPLIGFGDPGENVKHGRFAGAVWTDDAERFPIVEMHAQIIDSQQRAEAFGDSTEFESRAHSRLGRVVRPGPPQAPKTRRHP